MPQVDQRALTRLLRQATANAGGPKALAERANIHVSNIHAYVRGTQRPHWSTCASLARAGGVSEQDLLIAAGWDTRAGPVDLSQSPLVALVPQFSALDYRSQTLFLRLGRAILDELSA
jgi:hypothetical protein